MRTGGEKFVVQGSVLAGGNLNERGQRGKGRVHGAPLLRASHHLNNQRCKLCRGCTTGGVGIVCDQTGKWGLDLVTTGRVPSNHRHTRPKRPSIQPTVPGAPRSRIKEMNASPALTKKRPTSGRNAVGRCGSGPGNPGVPRVVRKPGQILLVRLAETRGGGESKERAVWMFSNWVAGNTGHRCNASIGANLMML